MEKSAPSVIALPAQLPGVDLPSALKRCMGDAALLTEMLADFRRHFRDADVRMRALCDSGDTENAWRFAHSVRGAAGNLSAAELADAAANLEKNLRGGNTADRAALLARFADAIGTVNSGITALLRLPT
jgi:HPt (histidine-containing phosphotransfer) domain-containing protein